MRLLASRVLVVWLTFALGLTATAQTSDSQPELLVTDSEVGRHGGRLVVALRAEPKTLNPLTGVNAPSQAVIGRMNANLIDINRETQRTTPALAKSWTASPDGRRYTLHLRRGLKFSDGHPFDADDVVFSFEAYLDERSHAPQRDLLIVGGEPIKVRKLDSHTVVFELAAPYAAAARLFDGFAMLPRHRLDKQHRTGGLAELWGVGTPAAEIVGMGPFRLKTYAPGERLVLERNPHYWKVDAAGQRLPYLDEIVFLFVGSDDAQVVRFQAGETDVISRLSADNFALLEEEQATRDYQLHDLGPGLEYSFLFFNLNDGLAEKGLTEVAHKQAWFRETAFRQAISASLDRAGIARLVYRGRAVPLVTHVTPGNKLWLDKSLQAADRALQRARGLLTAVGFKWGQDGYLVDERGQPVGFSLLTSSSNTVRRQISTIIQDDLRELGIRVDVVALETRAILDRVVQTHDYEACLMAIRGGDVDPNGEMNVWLSSGSTHLWHLRQTKPVTHWEDEIDRLMNRQLTTLNYGERKVLYDKVQRLVAEELPLIPLVSPSILVGTRQGLRNFHPAILAHHTLWNAEELFWKDKRP